MSETDIDPAAGDLTGTTIGKAPLFWRVMRVLIILYTAGVAAFLLATVLTFGIGGLFDLWMLDEVDGVWSFLMWLWNLGTIGIVLLALSAMAWAVVWERAAGRPARRLERWYAVAATGWFAISAGVILAIILYELLQGNLHIVSDGLQEGGGFVAITNAPALIIGTYALWSRRQR